MNETSQRLPDGGAPGSKTTSIGKRAAVLAVAGVAVIAGLFYLVSRPARPSGPAERESALRRGVDFLCRSQLPSGEFPTWVSHERGLKRDAYFYGSPFVSAFVLYSTSFVQDPRLAAVTQKTLRFFLDEKQEPGIWSVWTSKNNLGQWVLPVPPDLDNTAVVCHALRQHGMAIESNRELMLANTNADGVFYTFLTPGRPPPPDICGVVNANVLFYLGDGEPTKGAAAFLNGIVATRAESRCSVWYNNDPFPFYYMFSRAFFNGAASLGPSKGAIIERVCLFQKPDGGFGDELSTAFAACTLLNLGYRGEVLDKAVGRLCRTQARDGSWRRRPFYGGRGFYFGSEELTTAISVEALARYAAVEGKGAAQPGSP